MKSISVPDNIHKWIMDNKDSGHKSAGEVLQKIRDDNVVFRHTMDRLLEEIGSNRVNPDDFTEDEINLIFQILDGPLQSEDDSVRDLANSIEDKLKR